VYYGNEGFEKFYGIAIPSSKVLEGLLLRLKRPAEAVEIRGAVCDKGMRMLAQERKDRLEEVEIERRDEEHNLRDIAEEKGGGRNKANKIKKRKHRSTREERPLTHEAYRLTPQDRSYIGEEIYFYPTHCLNHG
jgi:transcriptional adapter 3